MRRTVRLAVLLLSFVLVGCAPPMPKLTGPAKIADLRLSPGLEGNAPTQVAANANWWRPLLNRQGQQVVSLALAESPDLALAKGRVQQAAALLQVAGANLRPQVDASGQIEGNRWTKNQFYLPPYSGASSWNNALRLDFSYSLDLWGKNREQAKAAGFQLATAEQQQRAAALILENAVLQQLIANAGDDALLQQLHRQREILLQIEAIARLRQQHGLADSLHTLAIASQLVTVEQEIDRVEAQRQHSQEALAVLCGVGTRLPQNLEQVSLPTSSSWHSPQRVPAAWIANRPDVLARRSAIEAAAAAVHVARDDYYPNINLVAFAGGLAAAGGLFTFLHPGSLQAGVGPAISLPLFSGGRLRGQFDARRAAYKIALAQYRQTLLQALQEVAGALTELQAADRERQQLQEDQQVLQRKERVQQQRYRAGLSNQLPVLAAELSLLDNRLQRIRLDVHAQQTLINLYAGLGGRVPAGTWPSAGVHS